MVSALIAAFAAVADPVAVDVGLPRIGPERTVVGRSCDAVSVGILRRRSTREREARDDEQKLIQSAQQAARELERLFEQDTMDETQKQARTQ